MNLFVIVSKLNIGSLLEIICVSFTGKTYSWQRKKIDSKYTETGEQPVIFLHIVIQKYLASLPIGSF